MHMHIGIIEDNPDIRELLVTILEMQGHSVGTHITGVEFVQQVLSADTDDGPGPFPYDVLIVDLSLPDGMSGEEVLARLDRRFGGAPLPVVVLSGAGPDVLGRVRTAYPTISILTKPMHCSTLLAEIAATHASTVKGAK